MTPAPHSPPDRDSFVVTGLGLASSLGADLDENWRRLCAGESGFAPIEGFDLTGSSVHDGGHAPLPPGADIAALRRDGRARALAHYRHTIAEALESAGIAGPGVPAPERAALVIGSSLAASASSATFWESLFEHGAAGADYAELHSYDVEPMLAELAATFSIEGEAALVANACAAGASAVALGRDMLVAGEADLVIVAGGDPLELHTFAGFHALGLLTPEPLQPFRAARRGMKLGDGFAALVLEREADAHARGQRPRARLLGTGESGDAHSLTQPHPQGRGAALAMRRALHMAGCTPRDVDYVNLHATSTPSNDGSEYHALAQVFGARLHEVLMHAVKPSIGHTLGAAGTVEAVISVRVLEEQFVPATLGDGPIDPEFAGFEFPRASGPARVRCAMSNSFGFGGTNACLVFGAIDEETA